MVGIFEKNPERSQQSKLDGDKVKLTLHFRGREMAHLELGMQLLNKVRAEVAPIAKVEADPRLNGRQMMMLLAPR